MYSVVRLRDELQVDGRLGNNADGNRKDAMHGACKGRSDKAGGGPSIDKQEHRGHVQVSGLYAVVRENYFVCICAHPRSHAVGEFLLVAGILHNNAEGRHE